jgi:hypothetical protein
MAPLYETRKGSKSGFELNFPRIYKRQAYPDKNNYSHNPDSNYKAYKNYRRGPELEYTFQKS